MLTVFDYLILMLETPLAVGSTVVCMCSCVDTVLFVMRETEDRNFCSFKTIISRVLILLKGFWGVIMIESFLDVLGYQYGIYFSFLLHFFRGNKLVLLF